MMLRFLPEFETEGAPNTFLHAERFQPLVDPVAAKGAFLRAAIDRIEPDRIVWAGIATCLAPGAFFPVDQDDSIRPLINGAACGTGIQTGRILTVFARAGLPEETEVRVLANGQIRGGAMVINDPHPGTDLDPVLGLAGDHAGAAPDTPSPIEP
jgi:hypothetical protein